MLQPTGEHQDQDQTNQQVVSIPPGNVVEVAPGVPLRPDEDDVSDEQLAAMQAAFFSQGQPPQSQPPPQQQQPVPVTPDLPTMRYRPADQQEANLLQQAKATGKSLSELILGQLASPVAAPVQPPPADPVPPPAVPAPAVEVPPPVAPAPQVPVDQDPDVLSAIAAMDAAKKEFAEVGRLKADEPWTDGLALREAEAIAALSAAGTRKAIAEQQATQKAANALDSQRAAADAYVEQQFNQIVAAIPDWASNDQSNPFVQTRAQAMADLQRVNDPRLNGPDWQRHLLDVTLARLGGVPAPVPVRQPVQVATFNPPALAGVAAPVARPVLNADQLEAMDENEHDPYVTFVPRVRVV